MTEQQLQDSLDLTCNMRAGDPANPTRKEMAVEIAMLVNEINRLKSQRQFLLFALEEMVNTAKTPSAVPGEESTKRGLYAVEAAEVAIAWLKETNP